MGNGYVTTGDVCCWGRSGYLKGLPLPKRGLAPQEYVKRAMLLLSESGGGLFGGWL